MTLLWWVVAVLGLMSVLVCFSCAISYTDLDEAGKRRFLFVFVVALIAIIAGIIFIMRDW